MSGPNRELPLWLLDIDGVLNALARDGLPAEWDEHDWVQRLVITDIPGRGVMTLPILAARPVLDFVRDVHESGAAEIRWHSTWRAAAVTSFAPTLGLPTTIRMSFAPEWTDRPLAQWWKQAAAERARAAGRRLIWTDDDLRSYRAQTAHLEGTDGLLIAPESSTGLTSEHLDMIAGFLRRR